MEINKKSLEKLRDLINEETEYRSGFVLVNFFNYLGFEDKYESGFSSRWQYTDEKLKKINGTEKLKECIKIIFSPINYIENMERLDSLISTFNQYLIFDDWQINQNGKKIELKKINGEKEFKKN